MSDELLRNTRITVIADILTATKIYDGWHPQDLAVELLDKLENLDNALIEPPGRPHIVPAYGDEKSRKVVEALLAKPEVLYGVLGILHNMDVAGPWEHHEKKVKGSNDVLEEYWFRRDAQRGGHTARITPLDQKRGNTQCKWEIQNRDSSGNPSKPSGTAADLAAAMVAVDLYLATLANYILVPGFKEG